jgi:FixJ family two-component response regulator
MTTLHSGWVLVVDDDAAVRTALHNLLSAAGYKVATLRSASELFEDPRLHLPCCLVLDLCMPGVSGLDVQRRLLDAGLEVPIVFLTAHGDVPSTVEAMKRGAVDFLEKPVDPQALLTTVQRALDRGTLRRDLNKRLTSFRASLDSLSSRERSVLDGVVRGQLNKQIASDLDLTERTVKFHRGNVMRKVRAGSVAELARMMEQLRAAPSSASAADTKQDA